MISARIYCLCHSIILSYHYIYISLLYQLYVFCQCQDLLFVSQQDGNQMQSWQCGCLSPSFRPKYWSITTILAYFQILVLQVQQSIAKHCNIVCSVFPTQYWYYNNIERLLYTLVWLILVKYLVKGRIHWYQSRTFFSLYSQNIDL